VLFALIVACMPTHDPAAVEKSGATCVDCHYPEYVRTEADSLGDPAIPDHPDYFDSSHLSPIGRYYPKTCADCHNTTTWFGHPEAFFPLKTGPHASSSITCEMCHTPDANDYKLDAFGANTNCTTCHRADEPLDGGPATMTTGHSDQVASGFAYTSNNFCLKCHPTGIEAPHDEALFPSSHGRSTTCAQCHDRTKGSDAAGQNADCKRCHSVMKLMGVQEHTFDPNTEPSPGTRSSGCLMCHKGGGSP
jgi:hypothetical protein